MAIIKCTIAGCKSSGISSGIGISGILSAGNVILPPLKINYMTDYNIKVS